MAIEGHQLLRQFGVWLLDLRSRNPSGDWIRTGRFRTVQTMESTERVNNSVREVAETSVTPSAQLESQRPCIGYSIPISIFILIQMVQELRPEDAEARITPCRGLLNLDAEIESHQK